MRLAVGLVIAVLLDLALLALWVLSTIPENCDTGRDPGWLCTAQGVSEYIPYALIAALVVTALVTVIVIRQGAQELWGRRHH
jgi:hypothetical protein